MCNVTITEKACELYGIFLALHDLNEKFSKEEMQLFSACKAVYMSPETVIPFGTLAAESPNRIIA